MIREGVAWALRGALRHVSRVPGTRRVMHALSVASRGAGIAVLRCRRLVPDSQEGRGHPDYAKGSAMTPSELRREIGAVEGTLRFVHLGEALDALQRGVRLKDGLAVLTFDESFAANVELMLPVAHELGVPFTVFVTTRHLEEQTTLWDEEVRAVVDAVAPEPLAVDWIDSVLPTGTAAARQTAVHRLLLSLAALDEVQLEQRLQSLFTRIGGRPPPRPLDRMLARDELVRLRGDPLLSVGAHGHRHLALASAHDEALQDELVQPRALLREVCGSSFVDVMSYPFGRAPYVDERVERAARAAGYRAAFTAVPGVARPGDHMFRLPRLPIGPRRSGVVAYELAGSLAAVDEALMAATGAQARVASAPEG